MKVTRANPRSISSTKMLTALVVLQALFIARQSFVSTGPSSAMAQVPDGGAQRMQMLDEQRGTNARLDRIVALLESGKLQVRTAAADDKKDAR